MIPATLNINLYKASSHIILFSVVTPDGNPYDLQGTLTLEVFRRFEDTSFWDIELSKAGDLWQAEITPEETDLTATTYPFHLKQVDGDDVNHIVNGVIAISDVYRSTTTEVSDTITIDSVTNQVSVSSADAAAVAAIAAKDAAEGFADDAEESYLKIEGTELSGFSGSRTIDGEIYTWEDGILKTIT